MGARFGVDTTTIGIQPCDFYLTVDDDDSDDVDDISSDANYMITIVMIMRLNKPCWTTNAWNAHPKNPRHNYHYHHDVIIILNGSGQYWIHRECKPRICNT